jgi:hypothetical protein
MRFAVLHHIGWPAHADHYDLLRQTADGRDDNDTVLKAFASLTEEFPAPPSRLQLLPDHRRLYLAYEGPVSGDRGRVQRVDEGHLTFSHSWLPNALEMHFQLSGLKLHGDFMLRRVAGEVYSFVSAAERTTNKDGAHV